MTNSNKNLSPVQLRKAAIVQEVVNVLRTTDEPLTASQVHAKLTEGGSMDPKWIDVFEACKLVGQPVPGKGRVRYHDILDVVLEEVPSEPVQLELNLTTSEVHVGEFEGQELEVVIEQTC